MTKHTPIRFILLIFVTLCLSACVSTRNDTAEVDEEKALESHVNLALKYIDSKNRESARHHLRRAFELDKNSVDANFAMAMLYQLEGEPKLAEEYFKKTLRMNKNHTRARNNYGVFLYGYERYEEAYAEFEIAANDLDYDKRAEALMNQGRAALKIDRIEKAEAAFEQGNRLAPNLPQLKYELAALNYEQRDFSDAKRYLAQYERIARPAPQTLLLGIKIERVFGNKDKESSYALMLKNTYPYSREYLEYTQMQAE